MSNLNAPGVNVAFYEAGVSAIARGDKGVVAVIIREAGDVPPVAISQAADIPGGLSKNNQDYISRAFLGYVNPPRKVIVCAIGGSGGTGSGTADIVVDDDPDEGGEIIDDLDKADEELAVLRPGAGPALTAADAETAAAEGMTLAGALAYMATQDFDYLCGPADCTAEEAAAIASWVKSQRMNNGAKYKAVLPNTAADDAAIVNFTGAGMTDGTAVWTTAAYCSRIAGLIAGTPMRIAATYAPLPELAGVTRLTREEQDAAVNRGELVLVHDGRKVKLSRAVNSFVTTVEGKQDSFKKIKIVEIMDMIRTDITATAEDNYIGKYANSYDNKLLLVTAIRGYLEGLYLDGLVKSGYTVEIDTARQRAYLMGKGVDVDDMSEQEIKEADTGSHVFILVRCNILDAIEDIDINVEI